MLTYPNPNPMLTYPNPNPMLTYPNPNPMLTYPNPNPMLTYPNPMLSYPNPNRFSILMIGGFAAIVRPWRTARCMVCVTDMLYICVSFAVKNMQLYEIIITGNRCVNGKSVC